MSELKLVSPLLDGFQMGDPISSHDGVRCCPAIKENSDNKYIVKILSIPASQSQLDALLLTGAFQDAAGALNYFKELADDVIREAKLHKQLSRLDGFAPCEDWQVVPMEDNQLGYDVYLLTPYRRTLERYLKRNAMTHLEAVNLGLDICAALAACRRAGYIYVDLKPSNIFMSDEREYRIADLGFISMDSMKYAALPSKYRSSYSAPELHDAFATISDTADIYALGLILYQVYNDGVLPFENVPPAEAFAPPANADYEMAEIILKACHPDPAQRWEDPMAMGQALVAYMQRNTINDVPILPPVIADPEEETEETPEITEENTEEEVLNEEEAAEAEAEEAPAGEAAIETAEEETAEAPAEETEADPVEEVLEEVLEVIADETLPAEEDAQDLEADQLSEETTAMLAQAEELAAHEIPEPVVVHEPKLPEEEAEEESAPEETGEASSAEAKDDDDDDDEDSRDEVDIPIAIPDLEPAKKKGKKWLIAIIIALLVAGLSYAAYYYYQNYYLVPVETITLEGDTDEITAQVSVALDESILTAICTDTYGNTTTSKVENGQATFTGLKPGTQYTVSLKAEGFCKLVGNNAASFTTTRQTNIVSLSATTGAEDGSVILSFAIDGSDPENWTVEYGTEGEEKQTMSFTGHMVTIPGLTVGSPYTFRLMPTEQTDVEVVGTDTLEFTVSKVILAENVAIGSFKDGVMTIVWNAPADTQVDEWTIRCTDGGEYDQTLTVTDCTVQFSDTQIDKTYTLEILAQGMTQSVRADVTPKLLTVSSINCTLMNASTLRITWEYEGDAPAAGWTVSCIMNGGDDAVLTSDTNAVDLSPVIPGASYTISVAGVETTYEAPAAGRFSGHGISANDLSFSTCATPAKANWNQKDVKDYKSTFSSGESVSFVVYSKANVKEDQVDVQVLYLLRDEQGNLLSASVKTMNWADMWHQNHFCTTLPEVVNNPGTYTAEIYFDGALAISKRITIK